MAGGRGRRRRQAAKNYDDDQNQTQWQNATRIPLSRGRCEPSSQHLPAAIPSLEIHPLVPSKETELKPMLELIGFESVTRCIFARIRNKDCAHETRNAGQPKTTTATHRRCCWRVEELVDRIVTELSIRNNETITTQNQQKAADTHQTKRLKPASVESSRVLLELGSVWVLDPATADRPQNKPVWKRLLKEEEEVHNNPRTVQTDRNDSLFWFDESMTLRVHSRPSRYPMARNFKKALKEQELTDNGCLTGSSSTSTSNNIHGGIVFERTIEKADPSFGGRQLAFAVLNKPVGMPSHSTVDNAVENILYQYQKHRNLNYASLPQRLDTLTSGLVLVTTHPKFATYFSKLLQQKTTTAAVTTTTTNLLTPPSIQKRYRCLVAFSGDSSDAIRHSFRKNYIQSGTVVEHYVDANSCAPKTFVPASEFQRIDDPCASTETTPTFNKTNINTKSSHTAGSTHKWQLCKLRINSMSGGPIQPKISSVPPESSSSTNGGNIVCFELEIDLLTGRTHQIRGQLAALGCPIFGDPLYGKAPSKDTTTGTKGLLLLPPPKPATPQPRDWTDRSVLRMALQCCALSFPIAESTDNDNDKPLLSVRGNNRDNPYHRQASEIPTESVEPPQTTADDGPYRPRRLEFRLNSAWWRND